MSGKRRVNVVSVWVIVIFTVVAATLVLMLNLVYGYISREELRHNLREQVELLADNGDVQLLDAIENQMLQRLAGKTGVAALVRRLAAGAEPATTDIRALAAALTETAAAFSQADRMELYFPRQQLVVGSTGVRFLEAKKYAVAASSYEDLTALYPADFKWIRRSLPGDQGEAVAQLTFLRLYPGVFQEGDQPMLMVSVSEAQFHARLRSVLRTITAADQVLLLSRDGTVFSAADETLVGAVLPAGDSALSLVALPNGRQARLAESPSAYGDWQYVIARESDEMGYGGLLSLWAVLIVVLLMAGLALVLWIMMKHYAQPMARLMRTLDIPPSPAESGRLSSPSQDFLQIESAIADISEAWQEQDAFLAQSGPLLRNSWLNLFIRGQTHYTAPLDQLGIRFPHPYFQAVVASAALTDGERTCILSAFPEKDWEIACFETLEKESVLLFNHDLSEDALPARLQSVCPALDEMGSGLVLGVGILARQEDVTAASFRCARRALTDRYFGESQRICVFRPQQFHQDSGQAMTQVLSQLSGLLGRVRHQSMGETNREIEAIVAQLKHETPYLNAMRSIMLLSAMFLSKVVYDMKRTPEDFYGENLMDAYYHLESIGDYEARMKADVGRLAEYWAQESSTSNRSLVQYAIHYIRSTPPAQLSIQSIADSLSISTGHLSRMFHQETGKKLVDYLQEVRMEHACRLLREGKLSNEEICQQVGYSRVQYFAAKFKERWGLTLNEYRRQAQAEKGA